MKKLVAMAAVAGLLLAACSSTSSTSDEATSAAAAPASSAAPSASGTSGTDLVTWAGEVCDATAALQESVTGIASAAASGGTDVGASVSAQFAVVGESAATLASTAAAIPADGTSPEAVAVRDSAQATQQSISALGDAVNELTQASGLGALPAIARVGAAATEALRHRRHDQQHPGALAAARASWARRSPRARPAWPSQQQ